MASVVAQEILGEAVMVMIAILDGIKNREKMLFRRLTLDRPVHRERLEL